MKKVLIAARELDCGGTEVAMLGLINELIKENYEITLLLARKRGVYLERIPSQVKIKEIPFYDERERFYISDDNELVKNKIEKNIIKITRKLMRGTDLVLKKINYNIDVYNKKLLSKTKFLEDEFDLAIDFYGYGCFQSAYISQKVKATKKIMWIHDERLIPISKTRCYYKDYDCFFGVSTACKEAFQKRFPEIKDKVGVFYNIINQEEVIEKSYEKININISTNKFNIVTVGRLEWQKGYDLAIDVADKMKKNNMKFIWYFIGEGSARNELEKKIKEKGLNKEIILLGRIDNPYPYIAMSNIYIQPSRHEGYGLAIAEARILNKAIIATNLKCIREQIINNENGYLAKFDVEYFYNAINKLYNDKKLIERVEKKLKVDNRKVYKEIDKIKKILENEI